MWKKFEKWFRRAPQPVVAQVPVAGLAYYRAEDHGDTDAPGRLLDCAMSRITNTMITPS